MKKVLAIAIAFLILEVSLHAQEQNSPDKKSGNDRQTVQTFEVKQKLNYLLYLPDGYKPDGDKKWPLLVFLHGAGERGSNIIGSRGMVRQNA